MKFLILGYGLIGRKLQNLLEKRGHDVTILFMNSTYSDHTLDTHIRYKKYDAVINCIGKTGRPNVDWCEDRKKETFESNVDVPFSITKLCNEHKQYWIHMSTGCIYSGDNDGKGFSETDKPNFFGSYYSISKYIAEQMIEYYDEGNCLLLRLRMPIDSKPSSRHLIDKLVTYKELINVDNSVKI